MRSSFWGLLALMMLPGTSVHGTEAVPGDLGFRWREGRCTNAAGELGWNTMSFATVSRTGFGECADFREQALTSVRAMGANLVGADFTGARLVFVELNRADLRGARFTGATSGYLWFNDADLRGADLRLANTDISWTFVFDDCTLLPEALGATASERRDAAIAEGARYEMAARCFASEAG